MWALSARTRFSSPPTTLRYVSCRCFSFLTRPLPPACVDSHFPSFPPPLQLHLTARHRSLGSHSAVLVDPEQTAVPVTHAKYGKTYHMYLENFPASTTLQLDLYSFKVRTQEKQGGREGRDGGEGDSTWGSLGGWCLV